ncbi:T9SS type A sorting domain-containing protein [Flavobacterium sp. SM15]|uniref:T9SS type A sorting domain-containing protein n=1 Tax=Flavobacterium sp. SM15 TaxID=2908005 RepID=UPI001EDA1AD6|nr:T9SS type A sorting domain-containing protein [Flavobacterium sp. SM15]MCG2610421.1 T9SS type A sorting domain-containing protein [Flavobacterium sp. SM15]
MNTKSIILTSAITIVSLLGAKAQTSLGNPINGTEQENSLGWCLSLSKDGSKVAVKHFNNNQTEHISVYHFENGNWVPFGNNITNDGGVISKGISLSLDGTKLAVERHLYTGNGNYLKSYRVYSYNSGTWSQLGSDINQENSINSGISPLALSSDGLRIVTASTTDFGNSSYQNRVRVHSFDGNDWVQTGTDIDVQDSSINTIPMIVTISSDGSRIATCTGQTQSGKTKIYHYNGTGWEQLGTDIYPEMIGYSTGWEIKLSSDGTKIALSDLENNDSSGKVRVFGYNGQNWVQLGNALTGESTTDNFGISLDLSADGTKIAIGAIGNDTNGEESGSVSVFHYADNNWTQLGTTLMGSAAYENFGHSVSLSDDGTRLAVGAPQFGPNYTGQVKVYDLTAILSSNEFVMNNCSVYPNPATNEVFVTLKQGLKLQQINLYSSEGKLLKSEKSEGNAQKIDLKECQSEGAYYVELITQKGKATKKILIKQ